MADRDSECSGKYLTLYEELSLVLKICSSAVTDIATNIVWPDCERPAVGAIRDARHLGSICFVRTFSTLSLKVKWLKQIPLHVFLCSYDLNHPNINSNLIENQIIITFFSIDISSSFKWTFFNWKCDSLLVSFEENVLAVIKLER